MWLHRAVCGQAPPPNLGNGRPVQPGRSPPELRSRGYIPHLLAMTVDRDVPADSRLSTADVMAQCLTAEAAASLCLTFGWVHHKVTLCAGCDHHSRTHDS